MYIETMGTQVSCAMCVGIISGMPPLELVEDVVISSYSLKGNGHKKPDAKAKISNRNLILKLAYF